MKNQELIDAINETIKAATTIRRDYVRGNREFNAYNFAYNCGAMMILKEIRWALKYGDFKPDEVIEILKIDANDED